MLALALLATSSANDDGLDEQRAIGAHRFKLKQQLSAARIKYRKDETTEALEEKLRTIQIEHAKRQTSWASLEGRYAAEVSARLSESAQWRERLADLEGAPPDGEAYRAMQRALSLDADAAAALFTGLHWVVRACMRSNLKAKALAAELADLKVHPPCVEPLVAAVERGRASAARADAAAHAVSLPTLDELRWRLDVSISSGALHRVMRPELTMRCALSDGAEHTFHVPRERLQELRYTAAKLLKDMKDLEMRLATAAGAAPPG